MKKYYELIYKDDDVIVVSKYAGVYSIAPRHEQRAIVLHDLLKNEYGDVFVLHRLDRDTSGLMVFAGNEKSHKELSRQFQNNEVEKTYYVFVDGVLDMEADDSYLIDVPIMIVPGIHKVRIHDKGKASQTKIRVVELYKNHSLIEAKLLTGRTHQVRVHMQYLGYPLIVDKYYGRRDEFFLSEIKKKYKINDDEIERPLVKRQTLHAYSLSFNHPVSGERLHFVSELPKDLKALRYQLKKN